MEITELGCRQGSAMLALVPATGFPPALRTALIGQLVKVQWRQGLPRLARMAL